ncbi:PTS sugar transporter subunit IIA [Clostridium sp. DL1XJH146]
MSKNSLLDEKLILLNTKVKDKFEALDNLSNLLYKEGYVKKSYMEAIKEREKNFATALPTEGVGVAIPHADIEHVNDPIIGICILEEPVEFCMMGNHDEKVSVEILFMLALKEHHAQIEMLQNLMELLQNKELLMELKNSKTTAKVMELLGNKF